MARCVVSLSHWRALHGKVAEHHRFLLRLQLGRVERIEADVAEVDEQIDAAIAPHAEAYHRVVQIPGVDRVAAATIIAELGTDMTDRFSLGEARGRMGWR